MKTNKIPLTMGEKIIGWITLDYDTGEVQGVLDKTLVTMLHETLGENLLELTFLGKPVIDHRLARKKFNEFMIDFKESEVLTSYEDMALTEREAKQIIFDRLSDQEVKLLMFDSKFDTTTFDWESFWVRYRRNI